MALSDNARGSLLMSASMAGFAINDGMMKVAFETIPVAQTLFMRSLFASAILLAMAWATGALAFRPRRRDRGPLVLRAVGEIGATGSFMMALAHMPLANATAVLQAAPLAVTMGAALFLGERVRWRRWSAIGVGFLGMLVIVQPGTEGFDAYAIFAVIAVVFITVRDLGTRQMSAETPTLFASAMSAFLILLGAGLLIPIEGFEPMGAPELALTLGAGLFVIVGYVTNVGSMRVGDVGAVSPFRYTVLVWALIIGYVLFGDVPGPATLVGAAIVVAAGLYTLWRERSVGQDAAATASSRPFGVPRGRRPRP